MGTLGYLVQSAPTVRAALTELATYLHVHDGGAVVTLSTDGPQAALSYDVLVDGVEGAEQIVDCAIAIGFNMLRGLCGSEWRLARLQFAHPKPGAVAPFKRFFGVTPTFDAGHSALTFGKEWLDRPLLSADPVLHTLMLERVTELQTKSQDDLIGKLRRTLRPLVPTPATSLEMAAKRLGMHGRTLNRRLAAQGTSFRKMREDVRLEAACQLLENTRTQLLQIADLLGYSDATALSRAFRRWSGVAPSIWRASRKGLAAPGRQSKTN